MWIATSPPSMPDACCGCTASPYGARARFRLTRATLGSWEAGKKPTARTMTESEPEESAIVSSSCSACRDGVQQPLVSMRLQALDALPRSKADWAANVPSLTRHLLRNTCICVNCMCHKV